MKPSTAPPDIRMAEEIPRRLLLPVAAIAIAGLSTALALRWAFGFPAEIFYGLFMKQEPAGAIFYGLAALAALALARWVSDGAVTRAVRWLGRRPLWPALAVATLLPVASIHVYHDYPLAMDEYSQTFQARIFAGGQLWAEYPTELIPRLIPPHFNGPFFEASRESGRVVSRYWPGFPLLLAPFEWLGAPWLLNPLLAAGTLLLMWHLARRLLPETDAAGWTVALAVASPQFTAYGISYYSMGAHLFLNLLYAALLLNPTGARLFLAGMAGSLALVLHQPLPHFLFALPWCVWLVWQPAAGFRLRRPLLLFLGYLPLGLVLGLGWYVLQWQLQLPGESAGEAIGRSLGLWRRIVVVLGIDGLPDPRIVTYRYLEYLKLFLWAVPGLPILAYLGFRKSRHVTGLRILGWSAAASILGFLLVPFSQGHGWGNRYFHQAWGVLPILAAAWLVSLGASRARWYRTVAVLAVLSLAGGTALRFYQIHGFIGDQRAQLPVLAARQKVVSFIDISEGYYRDDLIRNDPLLQDPLVMMVSHGREDDAALMRRWAPGARPIFDNGVDSVWAVEPRDP